MEKDKPRPERRIKLEAENDRPQRISMTLDEQHTLFIEKYTRLDRQLADLYERLEGLEKQVHHRLLEEEVEHTPPLSVLKTMMARIRGRIRKWK
jgi:hypothetical protein